MSIHAEKKQKSKSVTNVISKKKDIDRSSFQFTDKRSKTIQMKSLNELSKNRIKMFEMPIKQTQPIQKMTTHEHEELLERWKKVENKLDNIYKEDKSLTLHIYIELEAIRTYLSKNPSEVDFKMLRSKILAIEIWTNQPKSKQKKGIKSDNETLKLLGFHIEGEKALKSESLTKGDFLISGIAGSAGTHKSEDPGLIASFEKAVKSGKIKWSEFKGGTHNNVSDPSNPMVTFKAHMHGKGIKLYIDPSKGSKSEWRANYVLVSSDKSLKFDNFTKH